MFVADAGPAFDADEADNVEPIAEPAAAAPIAGELVVEEETIRSLLTAKGEALHVVIGVGQNDWRYTEADLHAIAPPLTRILNRYPQAAETVAVLGDPAAAGIGLFNYGLRSLSERRAVLAEREDEPDLPATGVHAPAPPGAEPTHDHEDRPTWTT